MVMLAAIWLPCADMLTVTNGYAHNVPMPNDGVQWNVLGSLCSYNKCNLCSTVVEADRQLSHLFRFFSTPGPQNADTGFQPYRSVFVCLSTASVPTVPDSLKECGGGEGIGLSVHRKTPCGPEPLTKSTSAICHNLEIRSAQLRKKPVCEHCPASKRHTCSFDTYLNAKTMLGFDLGCLGSIPQHTQMHQNISVRAHKFQAIS